MNGRIPQESPWNQETVARLEQLHREGLTSSQIGRELGVSRNAVIGKLTRTGLTQKAYREGYRQVPERRNRKRAAAVQATKRRSRGPASVIVWGRSEPIESTAEHPADMRRCSLVDLTVDTCRFPVGDPLTSDFFFCGNQTVRPLPYCLGHARISYQPPESRRRRQTGAPDASEKAFAR